MQRTMGRREGGVRRKEGEEEGEEEVGEEVQGVGGREDRSKLVVLGRGNG